MILGLLGIREQSGSDAPGLRLNHFAIGPEGMSLSEVPDTRAGSVGGDTEVREQ